MQRFRRFSSTTISTIRTLLSLTALSVLAPCEEVRADTVVDQVVAGTTEIRIDNQEVLKGPAFNYPRPEEPAIDPPYFCDPKGKVIAKTCGSLSRGSTKSVAEAANKECEKLNDNTRKNCRLKPDTLVLGPNCQFAIHCKGKSIQAEITIQPQSFDCICDEKKKDLAADAQVINPSEAAQSLLVLEAIYNSLDSDALPLTP